MSAQPLVREHHQTDAASTSSTQSPGWSRTGHTVLRLRGGVTKVNPDSEDSSPDMPPPKPSNEAGNTAKVQTSTGGIGNHPSPNNGGRAPMMRIGFAGRHAPRGGRSTVEFEPSLDDNSHADLEQGGQGPPAVRIGYAARGARVGPATFVGGGRPKTIEKKQEEQGKSGEVKSEEGK